MLRGRIPALAQTLRDRAGWLFRLGVLVPVVNDGGNSNESDSSEGTMMYLHFIGMDEGRLKTRLLLMPASHKMEIGGMMMTVVVVVVVVV